MGIYGKVYAALTAEEWIDVTEAAFAATGVINGSLRLNLLSPLIAS